MMDSVLSGSLLVVFSLFCYAMCVFFEQINSLSLSLSLSGCHIGNESVPIKLAQCWFPGLAFPMLIYKYIFRK